MKNITRLEDVAILLLAAYLFTTLPYPWWLYPLLFFLPDLSLLVLLLGKKPGAMAYNLLHHRLAPALLFILGSLLHQPLLALTGVVLLGHASFDRALGLPLMALVPPPTSASQTASVPVS